VNSSQEGNKINATKKDVAVVSYIRGVSEQHRLLIKKQLPLVFGLHLIHSVNS